MKRTLDNHRRLLLRLLHAGLIMLALGSAYLLQFDFAIPSSAMPQLYRGIWTVLLVKMVVFSMSKLDRRWSWRFAGMSDLFRLLIANVVASLAFVISSRLLTGAFYPASLYCLDFVFCLTLMVGAQFSVRLYIEGVANGSSKNGGKAIFIYGAGEAGAMLVREMHANPRLNYRLVGFLDDDRQKHDTTIMGVPVLGSGSDATWLVQRSQNRGHKIEEIIIAIPSATGKRCAKCLPTAA
jgi:FlaA1/EpsC-like NDP-sugar epimerase